MANLFNKLLGSLVFAALIFSLESKSRAMTDALSPPEAKRLKLAHSDAGNNEDVCGDSAPATMPAKEARTDAPPQSGKGDATEAEKGTIFYTENDFGITEYINKQEGFHGVLKQRFSDFLVHEIDMDGRVVTLTNSDIPTPGEEEARYQVGKEVGDRLPANKIEELKELLASKDYNKAVLFKVGEDKSERTAIHHAVADGFPGLDSTTITDKKGQRFIQVKLTVIKASNRNEWPRGRGDYCRFVLYKENKDTMDAINLIATNLGLKPGFFQYAGTKDRRAKTSQYITAYRLPASKLVLLNKRLRNIVTGNYSYVKQGLKLGHLQGNKFTVILRSVTGSTDHLEAAVKSLQDVGFINYYGMQRFGTTAIPTHHIGRAILQGNWQEAVELLLKPRDGEDEEITKARRCWMEHRDCNKALDLFPRRCHNERVLLIGLLKAGPHTKNPYLPALEKIPRNTRLMYVHSYQSYVWNNAASYRIKQFGLAPVVGDLVITRERREQEMDPEDEAKWEQRNKKPEPEVVQQHNISQFTMEDVVLPLPGYDVLYPDTVRQLYQDLMAKDGLDCDNMRNKVKDFSLSGDYRHVLVRPGQVGHAMYKYDDVTLPLALSDVEKMVNVPEPESIPDGAHTAVRLDLTLPTSCYATMAIREILKTDTSSAHQSTLNVT